MQSPKYANASYVTCVLQQKLSQLMMSASHSCQTPQQHPIFYLNHQMSGKSANHKLQCSKKLNIVK